MIKALGAMLLAGALAFLTSGTANTFAQQAKKGAKAGTIEIVESKDSKYRYTIRDADGKYLAGSTTPHATEKEAKNAVEELKKMLPTATYVSKKSDDKGKSN